MSTWRSIAEEPLANIPTMVAPWDEKSFLGWDPYLGKPVIAWWSSEDKHFKYDDDDLAELYRMGPHLSHWMPLPSSPEPQETKRA